MGSYWSYPTEDQPKVEVENKVEVQKKKSFPVAPPNTPEDSPLPSPSRIRRHSQSGQVYPKYRRKPNYLL